MNHSPDLIQDTHTLSALPSLTSNVALAAAATVLLMFAIYLLTGIGQDPLQFVHIPQEYTSILLQNPQTLRLAIGLDNLFIVFYSTMFLALGATVWKHTPSTVVLSAAIALMGLSGLLDLLENMHFLTMISTAVEGLPISATQIELQVWESLIKFHVSYLGLFLLGFALPNQTWQENALCFSLRWVQLPVGLLIYLTPPAIARPLVMARFTFFLFALLIIFLIFRQRKSGSDAPH